MDTKEHGQEQGYFGVLTSNPIFGVAVWLFVAVVVFVIGYAVGASSADEVHNRAIADTKAEGARRLDELKKKYEAHANEIYQKGAQAAADTISSRFWLVPKPPQDDPSTAEAQ